MISSWDIEKGLQNQQTKKDHLERYDDLFLTAGVAAADKGGCQQTVRAIPSRGYPDKS